MAILPSFICKILEFKQDHESPLFIANGVSFLFSYGLHRLYLLG